MQNPKVIVITLNWNGKNLLDDCISSYLANDYPNFELVVIDNGSSDGSEEYVNERYPEVTTIQTGRNLGYSAGFNVGLQYAFEDLKADYALVTNNDVFVDSKIISSLVQTAELDESIGFTIGKVYFYDKPEYFQTVGKKGDPIKWNGGHIGANEKDVGQFEQIEERTFCDDIYWLVKRELYDKTGGYDTTFFLQAEDFDWQVRAKKLGYKIVYTPNAKLWHKESVTLGKSSPIKLYYDSRNPLIVVFKHQTPDFVRNYFWYFFKHQVFKPSFRGLIRSLTLLRFIKIWQGFFSAVVWGFKNKRISIRLIFSKRKLGNAS